MGANASVSTACHSACTRASRSLQLWTIPGERLQLEPDLLIRKVLVEIGHRRPPLHEERHVRRIHLALPLDEPFGKPFEHAHRQLLHGAEVVVDEAVIRPGLLGDLAGCDPARADLDEQPLSGVEERLLRLVPGIRTAGLDICISHLTKSRRECQGRLCGRALANAILGNGETPTPRSGRSRSGDATGGVTHVHNPGSSTGGHADRDGADGAVRSSDQLPQLPLRPN